MTRFDLPGRHSEPPGGAGPAGAEAMPRFDGHGPGPSAGPSGHPSGNPAGNPARLNGHRIAPVRRPLYAALDLGTNNCRLLIARPAAEGFRVIDAFSRIVRLGEGLGARGLLSEAAMARTLDALRVCAAKIDRRGVTHLRAVATEACRRAGNCSEFLARVERETGIVLEIIDGIEEARLALLGCAPLLDPALPHALIFDIGGGSTEICWFEADASRTLHQRSRPDRPDGAAEGPGPANGATGGDGGNGAGGDPLLRAWRSLPCGVVTLAEHYGGREVSAETYEAMVAEVLARLQAFEAEHGLARTIARGELQMVGTSGTVTTLAGIHKRLPRYDRSLIDGCFLDFATARQVTDELLGLGYPERVAHPCIGPERADLVIAGCAILEAICRTWPVGRLRVADRGLREGILFTLMQGVEEVAAEAGAVPPRPAASLDGRPA
ncbi:exopolyphosphatase / guanosine-5'-triphosphate,3'-diphosphate pyrophosphatase [Tistlia consotensis]|uniref:Exopolyphosphatase / guanosine-5'-triphosphate,3'-diphosphate pyrophosphatase n=1 Tax=Tistlia consotensis USBA 355 TaxID=560819 RepID=A0A1Y6BEI4_9PROT|nr:Ppx/GppA phosphatase family protein [Tistlia consotensis]SME99406.1 exopolyphosphatase / guanosine-5'-triphosphate,3'-diphosphate pyrophosphatase [Tistlia consotensis USBA 355]SNR76915.1 exopolyphosphatase / guanosine-5'-triphosphate,3'-diphosphate pyrophosphatase [Tistlia consotensis]